MRVSLLADPSVTSRVVAGLAYLRRQAEIAAQLLRRRKSRDVADRGQDSRRDDRPDSRYRHQANGLRILQSLACDRLVEKRELPDAVREFVDEPAQRFASLRPATAGRLSQRLAGLTEQMTRVLSGSGWRAKCAWIRPFVRTICSRTPIRSAVWRRRRCVSSSGDPDFRQKAAGMQLGQYHRIDLVGLHPGVGDCSDQSSDLRRRLAGRTVGEAVRPPRCCRSPR